MDETDDEESDQEESAADLLQDCKDSESINCFGRSDQPRHDDRWKQPLHTTITPASAPHDFDHSRSGHSHHKSKAVKEHDTKRSEKDEKYLRGSEYERPKYAGRGAFRDDDRHSVAKPEWSVREKSVTKKDSKRSRHHGKKETRDLDEKRDTRRGEKTYGRKDERKAYGGDDEKDTKRGERKTERKVKKRDQKQSPYKQDQRKPYEKIKDSKPYKKRVEEGSEQPFEGKIPEAIKKKKEKYAEKTFMQGVRSMFFLNLSTQEFSD